MPYYQFVDAICCKDDFRCPQLTGSDRAYEPGQKPGQKQKGSISGFDIASIVAQAQAQIFEGTVKSVYWTGSGKNDRCGNGEGLGYGVLGCCGRGPCNIFCCNCDNGCKCDLSKYCYIAGDGTVTKNGVRFSTRFPCAHQVRDGRSLEGPANGTSDGLEIMKSADVDGDGLMSLDEAASYLVAVGKLSEENNRERRDASTPEWFAAIDSNGDGFIQLEEIDSDE